MRSPSRSGSAARGLRRVLGLVAAARPAALSILRPGAPGGDRSSRPRGRPLRRVCAPPVRAGRRVLRSRLRRAGPALPASCEARWPAGAARAARGAARPGGPTVRLRPGLHEGGHSAGPLLVAAASRVRPGSRAGACGRAQARHTARLAATAALFPRCSGQVPARPRSPGPAGQRFRFASEDPRPPCTARRRRPDDRGDGSRLRGRSSPVRGTRGTGRRLGPDAAAPGLTGRERPSYNGGFAITSRAVCLE